MIDFTLRPWTVSDLDNLVMNANNSKIAGNMTDAFPHPYTRQNGKAFIEFATQRVLEKAGFKLEARFEKTIIKNGVLLDELIYSMRRKK